MKNRWNRRKTLVLWLVIAVVFLIAVCISGLFCEDAEYNCILKRKTAGDRKSDRKRNQT